MKKSRGSSLFLGTICIMFVTVLLTYFVLQSMGIVSKDKMKVEFSVNNVEEVYSKEYDGKVIDINEIQIISEPQLVQGHTLKASITNNVCDAGDYSLNINIDIFDEKNKDVTDMYDFVNPLLNCSISKRKVKIESFNNKLGDLTYTDYQVISGSLLEGHTITMLMNDGKRVPMVTYRYGSVNDNYELAVINTKPDEGTGNDNDPTKPTLELRHKNITKTYDGKPVEVKLEDVNQVLGRNDVISFKALTIDNVELTRVIFPIDTTYYVDPTTVTITREGVDITSEYNINITNEYGNLIINKQELNVEAKTFTKYFDGNSFDVTELEKINRTGLVGSDTLKINLLNDVKTLTKVGTYDLTIEYKVLNELGLDVTNCYNIIKPTIRLIINPVTYTLDFKKYEMNKEYDGVELLYTVHDLEVKSNGNVIPNSSEILKNLNVKFKYTLNNKPVYSIKDAGTYQVTIESATYVDPNISFIYDSIVTYKVTPKTLTFAFTNAFNVMIPYQGSVIDLVNYNDKYTLSGVCAGDIVNPTFKTIKTNLDGSTVDQEMKNVGNYKVVFSGIESNNTLVSNYEINTTPEISTNIQITELTLVFESVSKTIVYDGKEHYVPVPKLISKLAGNDRFVVDNTKKIKNVGSDENNTTIFTFYDENGVDVTDNYDTFSPEVGELIITPRKVKIETQTAVLSLTTNNNKPYFAKELKIINALADDQAAIRTALSGDDLFVDFSKYGVGIYDNSFTKTLDLENTYKNYEFEIVYGKVIVNP